MSKISDIIEDFLKDMIDERHGAIEIQRNEMATFFKCAPSQINYVITTRFSTNQGYYVESRRGGGGSIKIARLNSDTNSILEQVINDQIGQSLNKETAVQIAELLAERGFLAENQLRIVKAMVDDTTLSIIDKPLRDTLRADLLKVAIVAALAEVD